MQRSHPTHVGFKVAQSLPVEAPHTRDPVGLSSALELGEAFYLAVVAGDDRLADLAVLKSPLPAVLLEQLATASTQCGFQGAGCVVDARVDDARAVPGLVSRRRKLLLEHRHF